MSYPDFIYPTYKVIIEKTGTGEIRESPQPYPWYDHSYWMWTEGNFCCDCNRGDFFAQVKNEPDPDEKCGYTKYRVLKAIFPDGTEMSIDGTIIHSYS